MRAAIFLDRDGTLIREVGYLSSLTQIEILPDVPKALKLLKSLGYLLIIVTNQSGVARGFFDEPFVLQVHSVLQERFIEQGARIDAFYYCPHHPTEGKPPYDIDCDCRKPKTGMLKKAASEHDIDISRSWVIGDSLVDAQLAQNAGCKGIFLKVDCDLLLPPCCIVKPDLWEAASYIASQGALR
ncbi:D-glycero-D-manno-heptose 1,7-bisphosphate phosphatase [Acetomicrobium flavidum]|uniref:D,D-heptose 1,7-bisphosphate phosphatase n=1 Tax=Acetomicrobium flavidum TaxID=49896 RepID=A0ABY1JET0_9BACT|nr:D-glycero-D-manno-heptose 1,7-bisphosphate phosphatase [Acetomicrobium flavidum]